jgi:hypothetical protein
MKMYFANTTYWDEKNEIETPVLVEYEIIGVRNCSHYSVWVDLPGERGPDIIKLLSETEIKDLSNNLNDFHEWR